MPPDLKKDMERLRIFVELPRPDISAAMEFHSECPENELAGWAAGVTAHQWDRTFVFFKYESNGLRSKLDRGFVVAASS